MCMGRRLEGCWATSEGACDGHEEGKGHTAAVPEQFLHNTWAAGSTTYDNGGISRAKCVAKSGDVKVGECWGAGGCALLIKTHWVNWIVVEDKKKVYPHISRPIRTFACIISNVEGGAHLWAMGEHRRRETRQFENIMWAHQRERSWGRDMLFRKWCCALLLLLFCHFCLALFWRVCQKKRSVTLLSTFGGLLLLFFSGSFFFDDFFSVLTSFLKNCCFVWGDFCYCCCTVMSQLANELFLKMLTIDCLLDT